VVVCQRGGRWKRTDRGTGGRAPRGEDKKRRGRELCVLRPAHAFRERPRTQLVHLLLSAYSHPQECQIGRLLSSNRSIRGRVSRR